MEIAVFSKNSLKIKGKHTSFVVDPQMHIKTDTIVIEGPGDYEIGGVKLHGTQNGSGMIYNLNVDNVEILLGKLSSLEREQHKLKEQNIVVAFADNEKASFVTSLASNVVIFYGERVSELTSKLGKENVKTSQKYTATASRLPVEVETVILQ